MKSALVATYVVAMAIVIVSHVLLPETVAIHFGSGGEPDGWGSKTLNSVAFAAMYTIMFLLFLFIPRLCARLPPELVNVPNRTYWLSEANRPRFLSIMNRLMSEFGTVMMVFLAVVGLLTLEANLSDPVRLDERSFLSALAAFLGYTVWWCIRLFRAFRIPRNEPHGRPLRPR
jgi:uncharacterized membrane protein